VLDNAVENNEIYVVLCESVQTLEPQLQRLHSLLTNIRALLVKLREIASAANEAATEGGNSKGFSSSISKDFGLGKGRPRVGGRFNLESPELAPVISVSCCVHRVLCFDVCMLYCFTDRWSDERACRPSLLQLASCTLKIGLQCHDLRAPLHSSKFDVTLCL
jgi:hypothetical protein